MAKRLTEKQKDEITQLFIEGRTLNYLSIEFNCTKSTITRNIKKNIGETKFKEIIKKSQSIENIPVKKEIKKLFDVKNNTNTSNENPILEKDHNKHLEEESFSATPFIEITPLEYEIESSTQKDLSSIPISKIKFPKIVYMIVDKKIELETKYLKDYPDWQFLSQDELNRKTIEIYEDLKNAKRFCNKDQKVIKVPNTNVFRIVAPLLISRGISRIVSEDNLISL